MKTRANSVVDRRKKRSREQIKFEKNAAKGPKQAQGKNGAQGYAEMLGGSRRMLHVGEQQWERRQPRAVLYF